MAASQMSPFVADNLASAGVVALLTALFGPNAVADNLTAHAGGGQGSALALTGTYNRVTTVATAADSVALPLSQGPTQICIVTNAGANAMQVFGSGTDTIKSVATATGVSIPAGKTALFYANKAAAAGNWEMILSA